MEFNVELHKWIYFFQGESSIELSIYLNPQMT